MTARDETEELLPCPFCGSPAEIIDIEDGENAGGSCVSCTRCEASSALDFGRKENFVSKWNTRPSPARDEGAGTMGRGEEAVSLLRRLTQAALDMSTGIEVHNRMSPGAGARLEDIKGPVPSELHAAACAARNWLYDALAAPVSAPGMDREAVARIVDPDGWATFDRQRATLTNMGRDPETELGPWMYVKRSLAKADQIIALQRDAEPADGSQVEPSTTGTGRHNPLEPPPFIQWNGGENPAPGKEVRYRLREGSEDECTSDYVSWVHEGRSYDIIAYRIIPTDDQGGEGT